MRAGVVSDIHGSYDLLREAVKAMEPIDLLVHAGDGWYEITRLRREQRALTVVMVAGNCDPYVKGPLERTFHLGGYKVLLTHGHLYGAKSGPVGLLTRARETGADLVIYGHTHRPERTERHGIILFNPGSLSRVRVYGPPSYGTIEVTAEGLAPSVHFLRGGTA